MFGIEHFWLFVTTTALLTMTPGPTSIYVVSRSIAQGRKAGVLSSLGINSASLIHITAAVLGLTAIIATSASAFMVLKFAGALFLIILGVQALVSKRDLFDSAQADSDDIICWRVYLQGLLTDLLNPKTAIFFLAFFPQFIDQTSEAKIYQFVVLGFTYIVIGMIWEITLVSFATRITATIRNNASLAVWLKRGMGGIFIGLGLKLATDEI